ncbi:MAG: gamma-glutamyltransferase family protein, partial [Planctomycetota bacterium]
PDEGTHWEQPDLVATLTLISERGADAFYRGAIAELIADEMERGQGLITLEDLRAYHPVWRDPIEISYRGYTIYSMPPPSSGGVTLAQILNILEGFEELPPAGSPELIHLQAEAMRWSFRDRNRHLGDPDFVTIPLDRLLSKDYAANLRSRIDPRRASSTPPTAETTSESDHTTHYSVVDGQGRAAAITTTLNGLFGCGVTVTGAGFLLNNEMDDFTAAPNRPNQFGLVQGDVNSISPGKRMLSSMTPTIVVSAGGELELVLGTRGGPRIISSVFHVVSNLIDQGMGIGEAVGAPRVHHQALPDEILYEPAGLSEAQKTALRNMGHRLRRDSLTFGDVNTIWRNRDSWIGISDPRRSGGAVGY